MLDRPAPTLPTAYYRDPAHHERELEAIWWRSWVCIGRANDWVEAGDYRVVDIGGQQVIVTLNPQGDLRAFHNTCRHRGSRLCVQSAGRFRAGRIVCPYHAWSYSLDGELLSSSPALRGSMPFGAANLALYPVDLEVWAGFVFVWLEGPPAGPLADWVGPDAAALAAWPLDRLAIAHRESHEVACNWKIFWENFSECCHCPGIHPELCRLVPVYREGVSSVTDLPPGHPRASGAHSGQLAPGSVTWSHDGQTPLPWFPGLGETEQRAGMTFLTMLPSQFVIAHVDYVRTVRVLPLDAESTRLTIDWLLLPETLEARDVDIERLVRFGRQVVLEDTRVCELNQQGLGARVHQHGALMPQEHDVLAFDDWVRKRLGETPAG